VHRVDKPQDTIVLLVETRTISSRNHELGAFVEQNIRAVAAPAYRLGCRKSASPEISGQPPYVSGWAVIRRS
jgi:hypothetical protein